MSVCRVSDIGFRLWILAPSLDGEVSPTLGRNELAALYRALGTSGNPSGKHAKPASLSRTRPGNGPPLRNLWLMIAFLCSRGRTRSPVRRYPNSAHFDPVIQTRN